MVIGRNGVVCGQCACAARAYNNRMIIEVWRHLLRVLLQTVTPDSPTENNRTVTITVIVVIISSNNAASAEFAVSSSLGLRRPGWSRQPSLGWWRLRTGRHGERDLWYKTTATLAVILTQVERWRARFTRRNTSHPHRHAPRSSRRDAGPPSCVEFAVSIHGLSLATSLYLLLAFKRHWLIFFSTLHAIIILSLQWYFIRK